MKRFLSGLSLFVLFVAGSIYLPYKQANAAFGYGKRTFTVTAYYSPLPGQSFYAKGSYEADKRLNGEGIAGASGRKVFPGMLAAPKAYPFGTKIYLEGLGIGTVTDRGGAIVEAGNRGQNYDRIDVWMGHGEEGLRRAMKWGIRTVSGEVFTTTEHADTISFSGFGTASKAPALTREVLSAEIAKASTQVVPAEHEDPKQRKAEQAHALIAGTTWLPEYVGKGTTGEDAMLIQAALSKTGHYSMAMLPIYGENTARAVMQFQLEKGLIDATDHVAAGYFGPSTSRALMEELGTLGVSKEELLQEVRSLATRKVAPEALKEDVQQLVATSKQEPSVTTAAETLVGAVKPITSTKVAVFGEDIAPQHASVTFASSKTSSVSSRAPRQAELMVGTAEMKELQKKLRSLGVYDGAFTGIHGEATSKALRDLQVQGGLSRVDGVYTQETKEYIAGLWERHVATWGFTQQLALGDISPDVKRLQVLLQEQDFYTGAIDGEYDQDVEAAVLAFQLQHQVIDSQVSQGAGVVGPRTRGTLNNILFRL